jgi:outer membrane murein-binding lipoprotein Lpp
MFSSKLGATVLAILLLTGCAAQNGSSPDGNEQTGSTEGIQVDEGLLTVDITFPESLVNMGEQKMTQAKVDAAVKESGYLAGKLNEDGSVTYTMTKLKQQELLSSARKSFDEAIQAAIDENPTVKSITRSDDFSEIKIEVSKQDMTNGFLGLSFAFTAYFYQVLDGKEYATEVVYIDASTGEELSRTSYPLSN